MMGGSFAWQGEDFVGDAREIHALIHEKIVDNFRAMVLSYIKVAGGRIFDIFPISLKEYKFFRIQSMNVL